MLRLLGNLAEYRDTASILTQPNLLERIAIMISVENTQISDAALRTIRLLSKHKGYVRVSNLFITNKIEQQHINIYIAVFKLKTSEIT